MENIWPTSSRVFEKVGGFNMDPSLVLRMTNYGSFGKQRGGASFLGARKTEGFLLKTRRAGCAIPDSL